MPRASRKVVDGAWWSDVTCCLLFQHQKLLCLRVDKAALLVANLRETTPSAFDADHVPQPGPLTAHYCAHQGGARVHEWTTALLLIHLEIVLEIVDIGQWLLVLFLRA